MNGIQRLTVWIVGLLLAFLGFIYWASTQGTADPKVLEMISTVLKWILAGAFGGLTGGAVGGAVQARRTDPLLRRLEAQLMAIEEKLPV